MVSKSEVLRRIQGWPRTLSWNNFRDVGASQDPNDPTLAAHIKSLINPVNSKLKISPKPNSSGMYRFLDCGMKVELKYLSTWVVSTKKTLDLLSHEQGHYDIAGVVAVDICRSILELTAKSKQILMTKAQERINTYKKEWKKVDDRYDDKTEHGHKDKEFEQRTWKAAIQWAKDVEAYGFGGLAMLVYYGRL